MTLLVLMYHHASAGRYGNPAAMLDAHFAHVAKTCRCVLPGEALDDDRLNVCLSFDDGTYDFRAVVYPLLQKHGLRAMLAVPVSFIRETTDIPSDTRLQRCTERTPDNGDAGSHCTWPELIEMASSGTVSIAAHGFSHRRLDRDDVDLHTEIVVPRTILAARLGRTVDSFVLPYGRFTSKVVDEVRRHYRHVFRIGSADNDDWSGRCIYRVDADAMERFDAPFTPSKLFSYRFRQRWNALRGR